LYSIFFFFACSSVFLSSRWYNWNCFCNRFYRKGFKRMVFGRHKYTTLFISLPHNTTLHYFSQYLTTQHYPVQELNTKHYTILVPNNTKR
jgi:hypothetical protein